jgi:Kef-type K+ transport system membrane component KefB
MSTRITAVGVRRVVVLAVALFVMAALHALGVTAPTDGPDPTVVAAIGFVILAAFTIGEGTKALAMPSVTGYIATGLVLGPGITGFFSGPLVADMTIFNAMALALIALSAGLELHASSVKRIARTLTSTIALKVPLLAVLVGGTLLVLHFTIGLPGVTSDLHAVLIAAVFAVLSIATSSAVPIAVIAEHRSKGRYTDLVMMMPVVKDVVVVLTLAILVPMAQAATSGGSVDMELLRHLLVEIALTVVVGGALGVCLILYVRWVNREMLVFTVAMVLAVSELSRALNLEIILLFITAGIVVRNFSTYEHELIVPIRRIALPVFVVFFTTAGANIDVSGTLAVLPIAASITVTRTLAFYIANRIGARVGGESPVVQQWGFLGYLSQSAVNIGLTLIAARGIPALKESILSIGFATIAVHLLLGPVLLGIVLRKSGESALSPPKVVTDEPSVAPIPWAGCVDTTDPDVCALATRLRGEVETFLADERERLGNERAHILKLIDRAGRRGRGASEGPGWTEAQWAEARRLFDDDLPGRVDRLQRSLAACVQSAEPEVIRPFAQELLAPTPSDSRWTRLRKAVARARRRFIAQTTRRVPLRTVMRVGLEPAIASALLTLTRDRLRYRARLLDFARQSVDGVGAADAVHVVDAVAPRLQDASAHRESGLDDQFGRALEGALGRVAFVVARIDSPMLVRRAIRYSSVERKVAASTETRVVEAPRWLTLTRALLDTAEGATRLDGIGRAVDEAVRRHVTDPLEELESELTHCIDETSAALAGLAATLETSPKNDVLVDRLVVAAAGALSIESQSALRRSRARFRKAVQPPALRATLFQVIGHLPEKLLLVATDTPIDDAESPDAVSIVQVDLRARVEQGAADEIARAVSEALGPVQRAISTAPGRLKQAVTATTYTLELARQGRFDDESIRFDTIAKSIERARADAAEARAEILGALRQARQSIDAACQGALSQVRMELEVERRNRRARLAAVFDRALRGARFVGDGLSRTGRALAEAYDGWVKATLATPALRDRRLRSGAEVLDAAGMAAYLEERLPAPAARSLPPVVLRAFSGDSLTDRREAVAYRDELALVVSELSTVEGADARRALVVARRGMGRTTLVNMAQLRLGPARIIRLDEPIGARTRGLVSALAQELGCPDDPRAVAESARTTPTVVVIDGLEQWVTPSPEGLAALEAFLTAIPLSGAEVRWLVTVSASALAVIEEALPLRSTFRRVIVLDGLDWRGLERAITARERLTGHRFDYTPFVPLVGWLPFVPSGSEGYFRALAVRTGGSLRAALALHLSALSSKDDRTMAVTLGPPPTIPFLGALEPESRAALALMARFGSIEPDTLATSLGLPVERAVGLLNELELTGLVEPPGDGATRHRLAPHLEAAIETALIDDRLISVPAWMRRGGPR